MKRASTPVAPRDAFQVFVSPFALSLSRRTAGKSRISRWKEGGGSPSPDPAGNTASPPPTLTYTPLLRSLQMVITTVYKLIRPRAGEGTGNERRGVISADLSAARRAAAGSSAAGAVIYVSVPFAHKKISSDRCDPRRQRTENLLWEDGFLHFFSPGESK